MSYCLLFTLGSPLEAPKYACSLPGVRDIKVHYGQYSELEIKRNNT